MILTWKRVPVRIIRNATAVFVWLSLLRREWLCVLGATYRFLERHEDNRACFLPYKVRREIAMMRGALPLIYARIDRRAFGVALAQDAAVEPCMTPSGLKPLGTWCVAAAFPPPQGRA